jgi:hypothetical protein
MTHPPMSPKLWLPYSSGRLCLVDHQVDISALHATPRSRIRCEAVLESFRAFLIADRWKSVTGLWHTYDLLMTVAGRVRKRLFPARQAD